MAKVPAKCTQCGANIEIDDAADAGICPYCGTAFVTQKAINNYNTYVTAHITVDGKDADEMFGLVGAAKLNEAKEKCRRLQAAGMRTELVDEAEKIMKEYPDEPAGYAYAMTGFDEYAAYGTERYAGMLNARASHALLWQPLTPHYVHPLTICYEPLVKLTNASPSAKAEYAGVLERVRAIISDYDALMIKKLSKAVVMWAVRAGAFLLLALAGFVLYLTVNPFFIALTAGFGVMGVVFLLFMSLRIKQARTYTRTAPPNNKR